MACVDELKYDMAQFGQEFGKNLDEFFDEKIQNTLIVDSWKVMKYYVSKGGKRLRPFILSKVNSEFRQANNITDILIAFELFHNSTLIDDDIIDQHETRRGRPTLPVLYTNPKYKGEYPSIISSNLLVACGLDLIINADTQKDFKKDCLNAYCDMNKRMNEAQMLEINWRGKLSLSEKECLYQTESVAALFIEYMFKLGAKDINEFALAGRNLGIAFQLADDIMDVDSAKNKGRSLGADTRQGKPNILSIYAYRNLHGKAKSRFGSLFGNKGMQDDDLQWMIQQYQSTGAVKYTKEKIEGYVRQANTILSSIGIPKNHWIFTFGEYSLSRKN